MPRLVTTILIVGLLASVCAAAAAQETPEAGTQPQSEAALPRMLDIAWSAAPPLPQGLQDNEVALLGKFLISAGGFCSGADDDWKPGKYPRGFLSKVWALDLEREEQGWAELPPLPGNARQGMQGITVGDSFYVWGGFSYTPPYALKDGYRLSRSNGQWTWNPLPPLLWPSCWGGVCAIGPRIYILGGGDYDGEAFYTPADRTKKAERLGARLRVFDTAMPDKGWQELSPCPGTTRFTPATAAIDGKIYIIGGTCAKADPAAYFSVVDNWRYDPAAGAWERLRDMPISHSGFDGGAVVYQDRYILLPAGYQRELVMDPDGGTRPKYGKGSRVERTWKSHPRFEGTRFFNQCHVYDTKTGLFGTATPLPFDDNASVNVVVGDTVYLFPGETGGFEWKGEYFGHHPEFVLKGAIKVVGSSGGTVPSERVPE